MVVVNLDRKWKLGGGEEEEEERRRGTLPSNDASTGGEIMFSSFTSHKTSSRSGYYFLSHFQTSHPFPHTLMPTPLIHIRPSLLDLHVECVFLSLLIQD